MNKKTQAPLVRPDQSASISLAPGRVRNMFLTAALLATLGMTTTVFADRVGHDVAAGYVQVDGNNVNANTVMSLLVTVNQFGMTNNYNVSDHKIAIGPTNETGIPPFPQDDDVAGGVLISAVAQNLRNNQGSNMTHTISANGAISDDTAYEIATQGAPFAGSGVSSPEDNVNFSAAWFPYTSFYGGYARNSTAANGGVHDEFTGSPGLVLGTHYIDWKTAYALNGRAYVDLRPFGIDSRRDGVLLVNHAKNEANYAVSQVNNADDEWDGTWTIQVRDNRSNGLEQDPIIWVFVPKSNTELVSGMFTANGDITMYSGATPAFTVTNFSSGQYLLKVPGRSPADGVLIISGACGGGFNADNIFTYEPNAEGDGWIIQTRDLPNCGLQQMDDTDVVCSFAFIPAEKPGITVTPNDNLQTTEDLGTVQFTITLNGYPKPTADVTINLTSSDTTEGTVSPSSITFTPGDWNVPQTVTLTGVNDLDADGTQPYQINISNTSSADPNYNGLVSSSAYAINIDNEAGVALDASRVTTTEAGGTATFNVWLTGTPTADVTVDLASSDLSEATVSPATLTFTTTDYATPQTVTVTGVDDFVQDGPVTYFVVTAAAVSADPTYNGFDAINIQGENIDNDLAGVSIPAAKQTVTEPNLTTSFPVVLNSEPTADVTISFSSTDATEATVTPSITFTPGNWSTPQNVTITAVDDLVNDGTIAYSIITTVTSTDPVYAAIDPNDVSAETLDNEAAFALPSGDVTYGIGDIGKGIEGYATIEDTTADYNSGSLTVSLSPTAASDLLDVRNDGSGTGQIGVSGSTVSYEGVAIGTKSGGTGATALTVSLNASATPAAAQALVRAVTYRNTDANVAEQTKTATFVLADGDGGVSTASKSIIIRLLRVYTFQQNADGGFGAWTGANDCQLKWDQPNDLFPEGSGTYLGELYKALWIDWNENDLDGTQQSQALLRFTNVFGTGPGQIPPGAKIVSAELYMNVSDSGHGAYFHRMLVDWDADFSSYNTFGVPDGGGGYVDGGIQFNDVEALSATNAFFMDPANNTTSGTGIWEIGVTADLQAWLAGTANYGWVMTPKTNGANGTAYNPCESTNILLRPRLKVSWLPAAAPLSVASFQQDVDSYTGTVDTQVRFIDPDSTNNYAAYATLSPDSAVSTAAGVPIPNPNQVLLRFDNIVGTGAGQIPGGSIVKVAVLDLVSINADAQGAGATWHALLKPWADTDSWNWWIDGIATDGVEAAANVTTMLPREGYGRSVQPTSYSLDVTPDVQAWVSGTMANNGWAIMPWPGGNNGWAFNSADNAVVETRPRLRVYFEPGVVLGAPVYAGSSLQIPFTGLAGRTYTVQRRADLTTGSWSNVGTATAGGGGTGTFTDNGPLPSPMAFYRFVYP